jgi:hypothetical protein
LQAENVLEIKAYMRDSLVRLRLRNAPIAVARPQRRESGFPGNSNSCTCDRQKSPMKKRRRRLADRAQESDSGWWTLIASSGHISCSCIYFDAGVASRPNELQGWTLCPDS